MNAIVLAGGQGTRLKGVIRDLPKPMAPIGNKPFLEYLILQLRKAGIDEIVLSVGYRGEVIKSYFGDGEKLLVRISYSEEHEPLGTGGAVKKAFGMIRDDQAIVMNGDSFLEMDFGKLSACHREKNALATISLMAMEDAGRYGAVEVNEQRGVLSFTEKGLSRKGLINGGIYVLDRRVLDHMPAGSFSLEKEVFPGLVGKGLYGMEANGLFIDIGTPEDYLRLKDNSGILNAILKAMDGKYEG